MLSKIKQQQRQQINANFLRISLLFILLLYVAYSSVDIAYWQSELLK